jgi:hypothetical protein
MVGLVVGWRTPTGAPLVIVVDDTLFRRTGRHVHAAFWAYNGSRRVAAGQEKLSRGNTFVVAAVVVDLPFLQGPIALPVLFRLWRPGGPTKATLARDLIRLIAAARSDRRIHVVADGAYLCKTLRYLPTNVTLTGRCRATRRCGTSIPKTTRPYVCVLTYRVSMVHTVAATE